MAHSPAPFTVEPADHLGDPAYAVRAADGDFIAVGMVKADADLFAAAPDLLSALNALLVQVKETSAWDDAENGEDYALTSAVVEAEKAIAKAEGK